MISIIIPTKNRPILISKCVQSILQNIAQKYDAIVVDQSTTKETIHCIKQLYNSRLRLVQYKIGGKSAALNRGIDIAKGDILAFTDDDCFVSKQWLSTIQKSFMDNPNISVVFGKTLPYQPNRHKGQICPCIFLNENKKMITKPCLHYRHIGFGNNMAVRKSLFEEIGNFKEWLGPGSIGSNAEDAEMSLRLLIKGRKILYNPNMIVYHNKWLSANEMKKQHLSYVCGEMACYGYFHFQGHRFATKVVIRNIQNSYNKIKHIAKQLFLLRWNQKLLNEVYNVSSEIAWRGRGLVIGLVYALIDPIR